MRHIKSDLLMLAAIAIGTVGLLVIGEFLIDEPHLFGRRLFSVLAALFAMFGLFVILFRFLVRIWVGKY